ncbi:MAG: methylmalonyl-CoA epimerase [candidate division Zixibacteria bacterium]|nr:methylmalonyl-CoA epimerase [candidate division Zixibacteria bacterium]MDH3936685.1 methylmalonyl-CoA epimerase [candidate division Zixibacteria bacterium]MDH4034626.1 methylmalonyl-CoA epimerase [candidate division Zixibacteria bacterium]
MNRDLISHIGIAVADLSSAIQRYQLLIGKEPDHVTEVADQKVTVAMFAGQSAGSSKIELVAPTSPDSPVMSFLQKKGEGLHHLCISVDDIEAALVRLRSAGVRLIDETPRVGAQGNKIAFVHPSDMHGVLIELEQKV